MEKQIYHVYCESANYAGYGEDYYVMAEDEIAAENAAMEHAEDYFREQDYDQWFEELEDDEDDEEPAWATVIRSNLVTEANEFHDKIMNKTLGGANFIGY